MVIKIESYEKIIPDAYHGTSLQAAKNIENGSFISSRGKDQFLGDGIYFFENSKWHAEDWAKRRNLYPIAIIKAVINLGKCLDIAANEEHRKILKYARKKFRETLKNQLISDAVIINFIVKNIEKDIDTIRGVYTQPNYGKLYDESNFFRYTQLIICVRNTTKILKFWVLK